MSITNGCIKNLGKARVRGEISGLSLQTHAYFSIKDGAASMPCIVFARTLRQLNLTLQDGMEVVVTGIGEIYPRTGRLSLVLESVEIAGEGALMRQLRMLWQRLNSEGVFAQSKRPLPRFADTVGVITSQEGRVLHDIMTTVASRNPFVQVRLYPALVQGPGAPASLLRGLKQAWQERVCDVLIIGRGGGSVEELLAFSDETLTRAVAASPLPVISAVGHEPDFALTDYAADARAATPTQAGVLVTPFTADDLSQILSGLKNALDARLGMIFDQTAGRLREARLRLGRSGPEQRTQLLSHKLSALVDALDSRIGQHLSAAGVRLMSLAGRLDAAGRERLAESHNLLMRLQAALNAAGSGSFNEACARTARLKSLLGALNPRGVLSRGYSITRDSSGRPASVKTLKPGDRLTTELADGVVTSEVTAVPAP